MKTFFKYVFAVLLILILISIASGIRHLAKPEEDYSGANIAVIEIEGVILDSLPVLEQLRDIKKNENLKAVVLRVNSPGGAVGASQEIFMELKKLRKTKPVIVSMGDLAASGGLYVSLAGDIIVALPGTLTGSMGVLMQLTNFSRLLGKVFIDPVTIRSGALKDAGNPTHPLDPRAKELLEDLVQNTFRVFRETVQTERKLSDDTIKYMSDGRVIDGSQALKLKLVDQIGTFEDAVQVAKQKAKISDEPKLAWLSRKPKPFLERIVKGALEPVKELMKTSSALLQYRMEPVSK